MLSLCTTDTCLWSGFLTFSGGLISTSLLTCWIQPSSTTSLTLAMDTLGMDPKSVDLYLSDTTEHHPVHELPICLLKMSWSLSVYLQSFHYLLNAQPIISYGFGQSTILGQQVNIGLVTQAVASLTPPSYICTHTRSYTHTVWWFSGALGQRNSLGLPDLPFVSMWRGG